MQPPLEVDRASGLSFRAYGTAGRQVVLVHGGPGAPGSLAPVARGLAGTLRVLEPYQRRSARQPLTVARHVADLEAFVRSRCGAEPPVLLGHSFGAMLALAHAAAHPQAVSGVLAVGCGTFDLEARAVLEAARRKALGSAERLRHQRELADIADPDARLAAAGRLFLPADSFELETDELELAACDARGHDESWADMLRLQEEAVLPAALAAVECPVLMLHGSADPHPGRLIRDGLLACVPELEYVEWERCGHYPWLERATRERFFAACVDWIVRSGPPARHGRRPEAR